MAPTRFETLATDLKATYPLFHSWAPSPQSDFTAYEPVLSVFHSLVPDPDGPPHLYFILLFFSLLGQIFPFMRFLLISPKAYSFPSIVCPSVMLARPYLSNICLLPTNDNFLDWAHN